MALVQPDGLLGCWLWAGHREKTGYGRFSVDGHPKWAHRAAYEMFVGPIPAGADVCHSCDTRPCVNPVHLFIGTRAENMADAAAKGRTLRGERNRAAYLTVDKVLAIRAASGRRVDIAARFGTSPTNVSLIRRRQRWAHVA